MDRIRFESSSIENELAQLSEDQIDRLEFGAIQVDSTGKILYYSRQEGRLTGRDPADMLGRNFFDDVAPCTHTPQFRGRFFDGVEAGDLNALFTYTFDYRMNPTLVHVHMKAAEDGETYWILVRRLG